MDEMPIPYNWLKSTANCVINSDCQYKKYPLMILNTGEYYILSIRGEGYEDMLKLYSMLDVEITEINTEFCVSRKVAQFIYGSFGRVFPHSTVGIPEKLCDDIKKAIDFYDIQLHWKPDAPAKEHITVKSLLPQGVGYREVPLRTYIVFNKVYDMSIVVSSNEIQDIEDILKNYPEFTCGVESVEIAEASEQIQGAFKSVFHKKTMEGNVAIHDKYKSFLDLYGIISNNTEMKCVKAYVGWLYKITPEVDKRVKANDFYQDIIKKMAVSSSEETSFKRRVTSYLESFGIQKKRYSDAFYFCGLEKKDVDEYFLEDKTQSSYTNMHEFMRLSALQQHPKHHIRTNT